MKTQKGYALNLDQFERELMALVADLRVVENSYADPVARQEEFMRTASRHGFVK